MHYRGGIEVFKKIFFLGQVSNLLGMNVEK